MWRTLWEAATGISGELRRWQSGVTRRRTRPTPGVESWVLRVKRGNKKLLLGDLGTKVLGQAARSQTTTQFSWTEVAGSRSVFLLRRCLAPSPGVPSESSILPPIAQRSSQACNTSLTAALKSVTPKSTPYLCKSTGRLTSFLFVHSPYFPRANSFIMKKSSC